MAIYVLTGLIVGVLLTLFLYKVIKGDELDKKDRKADLKYWYKLKEEFKLMDDTINSVRAIELVNRYIRELERRAK